MKQLTALVVAAALTAALGAPALAQEDVLRPSLPVPLTYGIELGGNYNMFTQDIARPFPLDDSPFNAYADGDGFSWYGLLFADYEFQKGMGVQLKLGLDRKSFGNSFTGVADCALIRPGGSIDYQTVDMTVDYDVSATYLVLGTHFRLDLFNSDAFVTLGPTLHLRLDSTYQRERGTILSEGPCEFLDEGGAQIGKVVEVEQYIQSEPSARLGLEGSIGYRFDVSSDLSIAPILRYQFMLTEFIEDRGSGDQYRRYTYRDEFPATQGAIPIQISNTVLNSVQLGVALSLRP